MFATMRFTTMRYPPSYIASSDLPGAFECVAPPHSEDGRDGAYPTSSADFFDDGTRDNSRSARFKWGRSSISPSTPTTPTLGFLAKASTTARALASASADGVNASLMMGT